MMALASAPDTVSQNSQFFFPIQKFLMDCSAALLSIGTSGISERSSGIFPVLLQGNAQSRLWKRIKAEKGLLSLPQRMNAEGKQAMG